MAGLKTSGVNPHYPETSRRNHVSGSVILRARIGSDGDIHSLKVISTPDADLAIASLAAVRQWTYKPYLLNGEPVDVDTQITVNFFFGPP
jgi:TonB family protein